MGVDLGKMKKSTRHRDPKVEGCCLDKNLHSGTRFISQERAKWTKTSGQVDKWCYVGPMECHSAMKSTS